MRSWILNLIKVVVCASGDGSNFQALVEASRRHELGAEVVGLICNREKIGAIGRAQKLNIPYKVIEPSAFKNRADWDEAMVNQLQNWHANWVVLAGFLLLIGPAILNQFPGHVVNSHPALLPKFGGKGMYGDNVHAAVLAAQEQETGITIHYVDAKYDEGHVIAQKRISISPGESVDELSRRLRLIENQFYPAELAKLFTAQK